MTQESGPDLLTYLDSNVLIFATGAGRANTTPFVIRSIEAAWSLVNDPRRRFVVSTMHDLELLPGTRLKLKQVLRKRSPKSAKRLIAELNFLESFLRDPSWIRVSLDERLALVAMELASTAMGLTAADALHAAAACSAGAELITVEATSKPLFRIDPSRLKVINLLEFAPTL